MRLFLLTATLLALAVGGCDKSGFDDKNLPIALEEIPKTAMEAAQKKLPDVKFERAWKFQADGEDAYEIKGKTQKGKIWEVEVTASGKILEVE